MSTKNYVPVKMQKGKKENVYPTNNRQSIKCLKWEKKRVQRRWRLEGKTLKICCFFFCLENRDKKNCLLSSVVYKVFYFSKETKQKTAKTIDKR